jgi:glycerol-3-phosphate dehydrogenase subunit C
MREGSLEAPKRHKIDWQNPDFHDRAKIDAEMHRVFDICHGCRRCFNLCDSFPRLFDLVDASPTEVAGVDVKDYARVVEACTRCDSASRRNAPMCRRTNGRWISRISCCATAPPISATASPAGPSAS